MSSDHQDKRLAMAERLEAESDRTLEQWAELVRSSGQDGFMAGVAWLKSEHGLGHFQARLIAEVLRDGHL